MSKDSKFFIPGTFVTEINGEQCITSLTTNGLIVIYREKHKHFSISIKDLVELLDGQGIIKL